MSKEENIKELVKNTFSNIKRECGYTSIQNTSHDYGDNNRFGFSGNAYHPDGSKDEFSMGIKLNDKEAYLDRIYLAPNHQGNGNGIKILGHMVKLLKDASVEKLGIEAAGFQGIGSYVFARAGFSPNQEEWSKIKEKIRHVFDEYEIPEDFYAEKKIIEVAIDPDKSKSDNPQNIWIIADAGELGKSLLQACSPWSGSISFDDERAMSRLNAYVEKAKQKTIGV